MKAGLLTLCALGLAVATFSSFTESGGFAAVITGTDTDVDACIAAIYERDQITLTDAAYEVTYEHVDADKRKDIILKNTSEKYCGSAGCVFEICLIADSGVELIAFSYAAQDITILDSLTQQMHDIQLTGKSNVTLVWDTSNYRRSE